jgi:uncharacterized protein (TIGR00288 family)
MSPWWLRPPADADQPAEEGAPQTGPASVGDVLADRAPAAPPSGSGSGQAQPPFRVEALPEDLATPVAEEPAPVAAAAPGAEELDLEDEDEEEEAAGAPSAAETVSEASRRRRRRRRRRGGGATAGNGNGAAGAEAAASAPPLEEPDAEVESFEEDDEEDFEAPPVIAPTYYQPLPERPTALIERKMAMFCDFENIALGVRDSETKKFDIHLVLERLLEKGKIIVKRAYADWERYSDYKRALHEAAIELIDIPQRSYSGKNSADIKMVVDAMDLCYAKEHLDTFVVMSGDSDFSPLVSKLKENNKYVIGIGVKNSSSSLLVDNCDEFIFYEDVWRDRQGSAPAQVASGLNKKQTEVFALLVDAVLALKRENKDVLWGSMIKQTMQRKKPSFNEGYYGYSTFSELLEDAERNRIVKLRKDRRAGTYVVTGFARRS